MNVERTIETIKGEQEVLRAARDENIEIQNYAVRASILMALQDISLSLASIADYFTEKNNKKEK